jgi:hypothetical protein
MALTLGGCGQQGGDALAREACVHVGKSLRLYTDAQRTTNESVARSDLTRAYSELRAALPMAAMATSENGQWVALETTISESARVSEGDLLTGLRQECSVADSANPDQPPLPTSVPTVP